MGTIYYVVGTRYYVVGTRYYVVGTTYPSHALRSPLSVVLRIVAGTLHYFGAIKRRKLELFLVHHSTIYYGIIQQTLGIMGCHTILET